MRGSAIISLTAQPVAFRVFSFTCFDKPICKFCVNRSP